MSRIGFSKIASTFILFVLMFYCAIIVRENFSKENDSGPPSAYIRAMRFRELERIGIEVFRGNRQKENEARSVTVLHSGGSYPSVTVIDNVNPDIAVKVDTDHVYRRAGKEWSLRVLDYATTQGRVLFGGPPF